MPILLDFAGLLARVPSELDGDDRDDSAATAGAACLLCPAREELGVEAVPTQWCDELACSHAQDSSHRPAMGLAAPHALGRGRSVAIWERSVAWLCNLRRLLIRWEHHCSVYRGFFACAVLLLCVRRLVRAPSV